MKAQEKGALRGLARAVAGWAAARARVAVCSREAQRVEQQLLVENSPERRDELEALQGELSDARRELDKQEAAMLDGLAAVRAAEPKGEAH